MIRLALALTVVFSFFSTKSESQNQLLLLKDFQEEWLILSDNQYAPYDPSDAQVSTVYFIINPNTFHGDYLQIESDDEFSVFVNRKLLLTASGSRKISIDSLPADDGTGELLIAVNKKTAITRQTLSTQIFSDHLNQVNTESLPELRKGTFFRDFVITATLFLFVFFILMIQLNPQLSTDYFSLNKIFSLRENDDDQFYLRITSANILF